MKQITSKNNLFKQVIQFTLFLLFFVQGSNLLCAQITYDYKGFIFKHPYFENKTYFTEQSRISISVSRRFSDCSPTAVTFTGTKEKCAGIYIVNDSLYGLTNTLIVNTGTCAMNEIRFGNPKFIGVKPAGVSSNSILYSLKSKSIDTVAVCMAGNNGVVYMLKINTILFSTVKIDSVKLTNFSNSVITSISGTSTSYLSDDNGIWITGSNGLLRFIQYQNGALTTQSNFDISGKTVLCYGDGFAGTSDGEIYKRNGSRFDQVYLGTGALRYICSKGAAGDSVVLSNASGIWSGIYSGSSKYRSCNFSANSDALICEVTDSTWKIDTIHGPNTQTSIKSIQPASMAEHFSNNSAYLFANTNSPETLSVMLADFEKNFQSPIVRLKSSGHIIPDIITENQVVDNADPSMSCDDGRITFADSVINIILRPSVITIQTTLRRAAFDIVCEECQLKDSIYRFVNQWSGGDSLFIIEGSQKFVIVDKPGYVTQLSSIKQYTDKQALTVLNGKHLMNVSIPFQVRQIKSILAFDLYGKKVPLIYSSGQIIIKDVSHQMINFRFYLENGSVVTSRAVMLSR